jgi:predicted nucleotidyltransferase
MAETAVQDYDPRGDPVLRGFLARVREAVGKEPIEALLFGSRARGDHDPMSDYDLIMVYDEVTKPLRDTVRKVQSRYGLETGAVISVLLIAEPELLQARHEPYVVNACREGVTL